MVWDCPIRKFSIFRASRFCAAVKVVEAASADFVATAWLEGGAAFATIPPAIRN